MNGEIGAVFLVLAFMLGVICAGIKNGASVSTAFFVAVFGVALYFALGYGLYKNPWMPGSDYFAEQQLRRYGQHREYRDDRYYRRRRE